ncbi:hypothetical protein E3226_001585 [Legionella geestiana]|uniref:sterol desaturase family protein n=1 Tax=Legionella geestiana TaxID=45065 RepID=UPI001092365C|nr:sterol desaturase family protein [Legionella geestiana]QDQ39191.1 hypothetical protein E3226_001585 [Legionella geestiana]
MDNFDFEFFSVSRTLVFFLVLLVMIGLEYCFTLHHLGKKGMKRRRVTNWQLGLINMLVTYPISTLGAALYVQHYQIGLLHWMDAPMWVAFVVWFIVSDLILYTYHRFAHASDFLWQFHKIHHSETSPNLTTAYRLHPFEYLGINIYKVSCIFLFGPYFLVLYVVDFLHALFSFWEHCNIRIPKQLDKALSFVVTTPRYHLLHHTKKNCTYNFASVLTLWDWLSNRRIEPVLERADIEKLETGIDSLTDYGKLSNLLIPEFLASKLRRLNFIYSNYTLLVVGFFVAVWTLAFFLPFLHTGILGANPWMIAAYLFLSIHLSMITASLYLHRSETHRAVTYHPIITHLFRFWLWIATGTVRAEWVAIHRAHHQDPDGESDPHSPVRHGLKALFLSGIELYDRAKTSEIIRKYGYVSNNDVLEKRFYTPCATVGPIILLVVLTALIGLWAIPVWLCQMMGQIVLQASVINGLGHHFGYRNFETSDNSRNILPWGIMVVGEELHNNHHHAPASARFSSRPGEFDLGWFYLKGLKKAGLATIHRPHRPEERHQRSN